MPNAEHAPTLVCLIGPPAAGKTTVGRELCRRTGFKLFHGHVVADVLTPYFPQGTPSFQRLSQAWRQEFIEEALRAGLNLVITVAWRFDLPEDAETIAGWLEPYARDGRVVCVELEASLETRIERNQGEDRRRSKNAYWVTEDYLRRIDAEHRYDSGDGFPPDLPHLRLEIEHLAPQEAVGRIIEHFGLPVLPDA